ncbi:MAG: amidohydrolase family protein [Rhodothermales bacterium]
MNLLLSIFFALSLLISPVNDDPKAKRGTFALTNARIETVTNGVIENGTLIIRNDEIIAIGADIEIPPEAVVIDCGGQTIYPGMIDSGTQLGLVEISSIDRTVDSREVGDITPHVEALTAVNPNAVAIPVTRVSGVTTVITQPSGGMFPGQAAMINLHGYTPEQMSVAGKQYMMMSYPTTGRRSRFDRRSDEDIKKAADKAFKKLNEVWDQAALYTEIEAAYKASPQRDRRPEYNPQLISLMPVIRGEMPLVIQVNTAKDILSAIEWVKEQKIEKPIFSGVAEGWRVADEIAEAGIPCLVGPVLSTPTRGSDRFDKPYQNVGLMHKAGVKVAIRTGETENVRNLPFNAGFAAAYGMGREDAMRAVTITPAEIFGVSDMLGSLEVGKKANMIVADGDPFEPKTKINHVFIDGWQIPMENRQTRLYEEFLQREPGLDKQPKSPQVAEPIG